MKKKVLSILASVVGPVVLLGLIFITPIKSLAAGKVDCAKVMEELNSGKKPREVAKDLHVSRSSVYRCRKNARKAAKKGEENPSTGSEPAASPSP